MKKHMALVAVAATAVAAAGCAPGDCIHNGGAATTTVVGGSVTFVLDGASETLAVAAESAPGVCAVEVGGAACDANATMNHRLDMDCSLATGARLRLSWNYLTDLRRLDTTTDFETMDAHLTYWEEASESNLLGDCSAVVSDPTLTIIVDTAVGGWSARPDLVTEDYLRELRFAYVRNEAGFWLGGSETVPRCDFHLGIEFEIELRQTSDDMTTNYYCDCI